MWHKTIITSGRWLIWRVFLRIHTVTGHNYNWNTPQAFHPPGLTLARLHLPGPRNITHSGRVSYTKFTILNSEKNNKKSVISKSKQLQFIMYITGSKVDSHWKKLFIRQLKAIRDVLGGSTIDRGCNHKDRLSAPSVKWSIRTGCQRKVATQREPEGEVLPYCSPAGSGQES